MTRTHKITIGLIIGVAVVLIAWDLYVGFNEVKGDTISAIILEASRRYLAIPWAIGVLFMHLLFPRSSALLPWHGAKSTSVALACVAALDIVLRMMGYTHDFFPPLIAAVVGCVWGWAAWPNRGADGQ